MYTLHYNNYDKLSPSRDSQKDAAIHDILALYKLSLTTNGIAKDY